MTTNSSTPRSIVRRLAIAFSFALAYGLLLYLLIWVNDNGALSFIAGLFLLPMAVAGVATAVADPTGQGPLWPHIRNGWIVIALLVAISMLFFREGGICVAMAAPCFLVGSAAGSALTLLLLRQFRSPRSATFVIVLPLLGFPIEPHLSYPEYSGEVTTVIEIAAPPSAVWQNTVEIPDIDPAELPFTFSHHVVGVPHPENAAIVGKGVGAVRQLRWTKGVRFEEVVTDWDQDRHLAWEFRFGPDSIPDAVEAHIDVDSSYLKLANGEYTLELLPNGNTRLSLTTRYWIATPINAYCNLWGKIFLNDFHGAVLKIIKDRSERV